MRVLSHLKNMVVPPGAQQRRLIAGLFSGLDMWLDLRYETQLYLGLFERETHPWLKRFSADIGSAIDIGAASGEHTLFFLGKTTARKVVAFEPNGDIWPKLVANLELNNAKNSDRLILRQEYVASSSLPGTCSLDSLISELPMPCLIKIDVDGGEGEVLKGAEKLVRSSGVRWLIETHSMDLERECLQTLERGGCRTRVIPNAWWRYVLPEQRPGLHNRWLAAAHPEDVSLV